MTDLPLTPELVTYLPDVYIERFRVTALRPHCAPFGFGGTIAVFYPVRGFLWRSISCIHAYHGFRANQTAEADMFIRTYVVRVVLMPCRVAVRDTLIHGNQVVLPVITAHVIPTRKSQEADALLFQQLNHFRVETFHRIQGKQCYLVDFDVAFLRQPNVEPERLFLVFAGIFEI